MKKLNLNDFKKSNVEISKKSLLIVKGGETPPATPPCSPPRKHKDEEPITAWS